MNRSHLLGTTSLVSPLPDDTFLQGVVQQDPAPDAEAYKEADAAAKAWFLKTDAERVEEIGFWPAGSWSRPVIVAPESLVSAESAERALDDYETTARSVHLRHT